MNMQLTIVAVLFALALVGAMVYAQDADKPAADTPKGDLKNVDVKLLPQDNVQAGLDLYAQMAAKEKCNVFFSPYSISEALTMTYLGASGKTKEEMAKVLNVPMGHLKQKEITLWTD